MREDEEKKKREMSTQTPVPHTVCISYVVQRSVDLYNVTTSDSRLVAENLLLVGEVPGSIAGQVKPKISN